MSTFAPGPEETTQWEKTQPRNIKPEQWKKFDGCAAEIFPSAWTSTRPGPVPRNPSNE
ncbi:MAG TPA: hypothetical protein VMW11_02225 [Candidatus Dormibacteraeota bacterium]|nr:hypothetical protein [Candidatus Dormibacteraeota bacterium]